MRGLMAKLAAVSVLLAFGARHETLAQIQDDLNLVEAKAFHASHFTNVLVRNKPFKIRLQILNSFPHSVGVKINYQELTPTLQPKEPPSHVVNGMLSRHQLTQELTLKPGMNVLFFPQDAESVNTFFVHEPGPLCFQVFVQPLTQRLTETDPKNNRRTVCQPAELTRQFRIKYVPISLGFLPNPNPPTCESMQAFARANSDYLRGTFPVAELGDNVFVEQTSCSPISFAESFSTDLLDQLGEVVNKLDTMAYQIAEPKHGFFDILVGVYAANVAAPYGGLSVGSAHHAVVVDESYMSGIALAHEIGHALNWANQSQPPPLPGSVACTGMTPASHICGMQAPGFWINKNCPMGHFDPPALTSTRGDCVAGIPVDFMDEYYAPGSKVHAWVSKSTWEWLAFVLDVNCDPDARLFGADFILRVVDICTEHDSTILIRGNVDENGQTNLSPWYTLRSATHDLPLNRKGEYSIQYFDKGGKLLAETGADRLSSPNHGRTKSEFLNIRIPHVKGTKNLVVARGGKRLFAREVSPNAPTVRVKAPKGGETISPGKGLDIVWEGSDPDGDTITYLLFMSADGGRTWLPISQETRENKFIFHVPRTLLSQKISIKVIATDGLNTSSALSGTFSTLPKPLRPR